MKLDRIDTITLERTLPNVFLNESPRPSEVWRCDVVFRRPENVMVEAASGTGKSSLCAYIYGSRRDYDGRILFNGRDVATFSVNDWQELRRRHLAYLPQELSLFPELTAWQNVKLKNDLTGFVDDARIEAWFEQLGIADRRDYPVGRMSIGQQQRVAIIRTVCQPFDFLLIDEPVSHLDEDNNRIAAEIFTGEAARRGASIIATSVGNKIRVEVDRLLAL